MGVGTTTIITSASVSDAAWLVNSSCVAASNCASLTSPLGSWPRT
jgi:hypothetical protein